MELNESDSDDFLTDSEEEQDEAYSTKKRLSKGTKHSRKSPVGDMDSETGTEISDAMIVENAIDSPPPGTLSTLWYSREVFLSIFVVEKIIGWKSRPVVKLDWKDDVQLAEYPAEAQVISSKILTREDLWNDPKKRMEVSRIHPAQCPIVTVVAAETEASASKAKNTEPRYTLAPPRRPDEPPLEEEEVLLVKWRGRSYMHCSWERRKDIERLDPSNNTARNKIRRYLQAQEVQLGPNWKKIVGEEERAVTTGGVEENDGTPEMLEEEGYFPSQYIEVERILACDEGEMNLQIFAKQRALNLRAEQKELQKREEEENKLKESGLGADAAHVHLQRPGLLDNLPKVTDAEEPWDPEDNVRYVVKWKGLQYSEITWEYWRDIKRDAVDKAEDFWFRQKAPTPAEVNKIVSRPHPHVRDFRKLAASPEFAQSKRPRPVADLGDDFKLNKEEEENGKAFKLRSYQLEGVNWLLFNWFNKRSCILADEMGLGKTIQTLGFLHQLNELPATQVRGPFLVVAPLTLIGQWQSESQTWTPDFNVVFYHGSADARDFLTKHEFYHTDQFSQKGHVTKLRQKNILKVQILITTYEVVLKDVAVLSKIRWKALIVDEAHRLKNPKARLFEELASVPRDFCLLLTGTPLQNSTEELWALLHFSDPVVFASRDSFVEKFGELKHAKQVSDLHAMLKPYLLRRVKEDVEKALPPKEETILEVALVPIQKKYYRAVYERNTAFLFKGAKPSNAPSLMNVMMELRKCCNHPFLIRGAEERILNEAAEALKGQKDEEGNERPVDYLKLFGEQLVKSSGKMVLLEKLLPKLFSGDHKVLIFSQMVKTLDLIEELLKMRKYRYERLDGSTSASARTSGVHRFQRKSCQCMLLSTRAGGLGLNLTAASSVIIFDSDWNPQNDLQAMARAHRIGQTRAVSVYRLLTAKTYEMHMFHSASMKLGLDRAVLAHQRQQGTGSGDDSKPKSISDRKVQAQEIDQLLKKGAYDVFRDDDDTEAKQFMETDIDQLLEKSAKKVTYGENNASSISSGLGSFSKASFVADTGDGDKDVDLDDPDFWSKAVGLEKPEETPEEVAAMIDDGVKRKRTQVQQFDPYAAFADAEQKKKDKVALKAKEEKEEKQRLRKEKKQQRLEEKERKKREREEARGRLFGQSKRQKTKDEAADSAPKSAKEGKPKKLKKSERQRALRRAENEDPLLERLKQAWEVPQRNRATSAALRFGFGRFCKIRNESSLTSLPLQDMEIFVRQYVYQLSLQVAVSFLAILRSKLTTINNEDAVKVHLRELLRNCLGPRCSQELDWIASSICSSIKMQVEVENRRRFLRMPLILAEPAYMNELRQGAALRALRRIGVLNRLNQVVEDVLDDILSEMGQDELGRRGCTTKNLSNMDTDLKARHVTAEELLLAVGNILPYEEGDVRSPTVWWDRRCDVALIVGTFIHGLGNYESMRNDEDLPFGSTIRRHSEVDKSSTGAFLCFDSASRAARKVFDKALDSAKSKAQAEQHAVVAAVVAAKKQAEKEGDSDAKVPSDVVESNMLMEADADDSHYVTLPRLAHAMVSKIRTPREGVVAEVKSEQAETSSSSDKIIEATVVEVQKEEEDVLEPQHRLPMPDARILDGHLLGLLDIMEGNVNTDGPKAENSQDLEASPSVLAHNRAQSEALHMSTALPKHSVEVERFEHGGIGYSGNQCGTAHRSLDDASDFSIGAASSELSYIANGTDAPRYLRAIGVPMNFTRYAVLALLYSDRKTLEGMLKAEQAGNVHDSDESQEASNGVKDSSDGKDGNDKETEKVKKETVNDVTSLPDADKQLSTQAAPSSLPQIVIMPEIRNSDQLRAGICATAVHFGFPSSTSANSLHPSLAEHMKKHSCVLGKIDQGLFSFEAFRTQAGHVAGVAIEIGMAKMTEYVEHVLLPHCLRLCIFGNGPVTRTARGSKGKYETALGYSLYPEHTAKRQTPLPDPCSDIGEHSIEAVTSAMALLRRVRLLRAAQHLVQDSCAEHLLELVKSPGFCESLEDLPIWWCPWIHDVALVAYTATSGLGAVSRLQDKADSIFGMPAIEQHIRKVFVEERRLPPIPMTEEEVTQWVQGQASKFPAANALERRLAFVCGKATTAHLDPQHTARYDHLPMFDHGGWPRN